MSRFIFSIVLMALCFSASSEEWQPNWKTVVFPNSADAIMVAEDKDPGPPGIRVVWVYIVHEKPVPARYFKQQLFAAEIQEWWLNCNKLSASIATIRYTNELFPNPQGKYVLVHPFGISDPPLESARLVCEAVT